MNYVLYGEEQYRLKRTLETIVKEYLPDENDLNLVRYDAMHTDIATIIEDAMTVPFFSSYKVIIVDHANFLSTLNNTASDIKVLESYLQNPCDSTVLIFTGDFAKLDTRKKIVKTIKKMWKVLEFKKLDEVGKNSVINEEIQKRKLNITENAKQILLKRLPLDMETIQNEMTKLELYQGLLDENAVSSLVNRPLEEDVFQLVDAVVEKNKRKAFHIWQDLCVSNTDAIYLIALLAGQFRFLFEVKNLMIKGYGKDEIARVLNVHPYRVKLSMEKARSISIKSLMSMLDKLANLDQKLKSGLLDKKLGFEMFLLEL